MLSSSTLLGSDPRMLTRRALGPRRATVAPSEPGAWTDGVPTNPTVDPLPAPSVSVTRNDPAAEGIASTPTSRNWRTSVLPDAPPRGIWPTPMTLGRNAGTGILDAAARSGCISGGGLFQFQVHFRNFGRDADRIL